MHALACCVMTHCVAGRELPATAVDAGAATQVNKLLCDEDCLAKLDSIEAQETKSGLRFKDIVVGKGPSPPTGYQACSVSRDELASFAPFLHVPTARLLALRSCVGNR